MNISGVGTPASGALSNQYSAVCSAATSQRLQRLKERQLQQGGYDYAFESTSRVHDKKRLMPNKKREEQIAVQNIQYHLELSELLHSSSNEDFMRAVYGRKFRPEKVPSFLKKVVSNRQTFDIHREDCQNGVYDNDFTQEALLWHNIYRQRHNSSPLKLSSQLCEKAQTWANHLAHTNTFMYEAEKSIGQNIFCRFHADSTTEISAKDVVSFWYRYHKNYVFSETNEKLLVNIRAGSFSQLVWRSTKFFGIGQARSRTGKILVVANYQPAGNLRGMFKHNVQPVSFSASINDK